MLSEEAVQRETERILKLMVKYDPRAGNNLPKGDFYIQTSVQNTVWAGITATALLMLIWPLLLWLMSMSGEFVWLLLGIGIVLTVAIIHTVAVEWRLRWIQPVYGSFALGQVWIGQRTETWMFRRGGSSPDTLDLQEKEIDTPELGWLARALFKHDQRVRLPSGKEVLMDNDAVDFYQLRNHWVHKRNQNQVAGVDSRDFLATIAEFLTGPGGNTLLDKVRVIVREEMQRALVTLPRAVVEEFAKSFEVGSPEK